MSDTSPTMPEKAKGGIFIARQGKAPKLTPCGYPAGRLNASDGTTYRVLKTGQIVREGRPKMTKAEAKRHKKARRQGQEKR